MNAIITSYKKTALLAVVVVAMSINAALFAGCSACAAAAAVRQSIKDAQAAALAAGKTVSLEMELDAIPADTARAAREALDDPCNTGQTCADQINVCDLNCKLQALFDCCVNTNQHVVCQAHEAAKCCKKIRHDIDDVDDRVKDCCRDLTERIGDLDESAIDIPVCDFSIADTVNNMDLDMITWLKSLYVLLYQVYQCTCEPCIQ